MSSPPAEEVGDESPGTTAARGESCPTDLHCPPTQATSLQFVHGVPRRWASKRMQNQGRWRLSAAVTILPKDLITKSSPIPGTSHHLSFCCKPGLFQCRGEEHSQGFSVTLSWALSLAQLLPIKNSTSSLDACTAVW